MNYITSPHAPRAVGPYSQAVKVGDFVFCSGQIALDPTTNTMVDGDIAKQTKQVFRNLSAVLAASGLRLTDTVRLEVFLTDLSDFARMNDIYEAELGDHKPARATVEISKLPKDARIEISCIAYLTNQ